MRFAALFAALLAAAAGTADEVNITHHANAQLFSYVEGGPLLSAWDEDIPPMYIPGGVAPSNAVARLTDEQTRLAFVGTFDAYLRRFLASHAFGTADTKEYVAMGYWNTNRLYTIRDRDDWLVDETTLPLIHGHLGNIPTNGWACATNRIYAVTNISLAVTNWVGWTTNVVQLTNGHYRVTISNRYEATQKQIPDTARILKRYKDAHDYVRGATSQYLPANPNGLKGLLGPQPGDNVTFFSWPYRDSITASEATYRWKTNIVHGAQVVTLETNHQVQVEWNLSTNIGWSWSQVAGFVDIPQGVDPYALDTGGSWSEMLSECFPGEVWGWLYPTTWDIWSCSQSRQVIVSAFSDMCGATYNTMFGYNWTCEEDWNKTLERISSIPSNAYTVGYSMLTNLVQLCPPDKPEIHVHTNIVADERGIFTNVVEVVITNLQDRLHIVPDNRTSERINWTEWAGTDGFLALTDTTLIGVDAMPLLRYDNFSTQTWVEVDYSTPSDARSGVVLYGWGEYDYGNPAWHWTCTSDVCNVSRSFAMAYGDGDGYSWISEERHEGVKVGPTDAGVDGEFSPGELLDAPTETEPGVGPNCGAPSFREVREMLSILARAYEYAPPQLSVGDVVYLDYQWSPKGKAAELSATPIPWVWGWVKAGRADLSNMYPDAQTVVAEYPGGFYVDIDNINVGANVGIVLETTKTRPRPYRYNLNKFVYTNSVPCGYPNPTYAGPDQIDKVAEIKATALSVIASCTNDENYTAWETNGYRFAFGSDVLESARDVDSFFLDTDLALDEKLKTFVGEERGIVPSEDMQSIANQVGNLFDVSILSDYGEGIAPKINAAIDAGRIDLSIWMSFDPCHAQITSISHGPGYGDPQHPEAWFDITYQVVRPEVVSNVYTWVSAFEPLRRGYSGYLNLSGVITNDLIETGGRMAQGKVRGMEAVKWDFKAMSPARQIQP